MRGLSIGLLLVPSCAAPGRDDGEGGGVFTVGSASAPGDGTEAGSTVDDDGAGPGPGSADDADDGDPPKFDLGSETGNADDGGDAPGCQKVDFLFVIDNSGSMGDNQESLIVSFPGFMQAISDTLQDAQDYHVMVVDTDQQWGGECGMLCAFFGSCPEIPAYPCADGPPSPCDATLGGGVNYTMATDAPNVPCNFSTGMRWMDSTEPNLTAAFQCAARVGSDGDGNEKQMSAMVAALSEELSAPGACNEGFLRDDAILVITIITDEEDSGSTGTPPGWYANVIAAKGGDASAIVVLGLINDIDQPNPVCPPETPDALDIRTFIEMFPNKFRGSVCAPSYDQFFLEAVGLIDTTCDDFTPPG